MFRYVRHLWLGFALLLTLPAFAAAQQPTPLAVSPDGGSRPVPDPTVLTTQAQEKAVIALRELFDAKVRAVEEEVRRQKETLDRADARVILRLDSMPEVIDAALLRLQRLMEEKFKGVDQQFQGRDVALAAALLAQKTSVADQQASNALSAAKQEANFIKQIDAIGLIIAGNQRGTDDKIDGVKALLVNQAKSIDDKIADLRNTVGDLRSRGAGQNDTWSYVIAGGSLLIAFLAFMRPWGTATAQLAQPHYAYQPYPPYPYQQQQQQQPTQVSVVPVVPVSVPPGR